MAPARSFARTVSACLAERRPVDLYYIVRSSDSHIVAAGAKLVCAEGMTPEAFGLGASVARKLCAKLSATDASTRQGVIDLEVAEGETFARLGVYVERLLPPLQCIIAGAGHVGAALADIAVAMGWSVVVVDDREDFADRRRFPDRVHVVCAPFDRVWDQLTIDRATAIALLTRGHRHDEACLAKLVDRDPFYVGMIGSRRRVRRALGELHAKGVPGSFTRRVFAPVGLPLATETPAEIALAVAAEIISVWRGRAGWARRQKEEFYESGRTEDLGTE